MLRPFESQLNRSTVVRYDALTGPFPPQQPSVACGIGSVQEGGGDMDVRGVGSVSGASPFRPASGVSAAPETAAPAKPQFPRDELQLSSAGKLLDQLSQNADVRQERLARIKEAIANGTYDTDEKLEAALSRMFDAVEAELRDE
uniref:Flagellar biosynthesis anti-sigma factor FlgM n=1 Tax=Schlesneria paludicola TaxID=360056 RepID=A0A7C2K153_9PLAN